MATKAKPGGLDVVDVLKPVFGKIQPRAKLRDIRKEVTDREFKSREKRALQAWASDKASSKELGEALVKMREIFYQTRGFTKWLRANGIDLNRAYYCIRVFENKVPEAQQKRKVYLTTVIKKDVDDVLRAATRKTETRDQIAFRIGKIIKDLCHGVGKAASWQRKKDGNKVNAMGEALMKALTDVLDAMYVTYDLDENGNLVESDSGRVFTDVGSAVATQEAQAQAAKAGQA